MQAAPGPNPNGKGKGKGKVNGPKDGKEPAPSGTCFQYWDHGRCDRKDAGQECKYNHIRPNHPSAPALIKAGKAAAKAKAKVKSKAKTTKGKGKGENDKKPKNHTYCRLLQMGTCKKGKDCDYFHDKAHAAPASDQTDRKKEKRKEAKARKKAAAGAVETGVAAAGPALSSDSDCSSTS